MSDSDTELLIDHDVNSNGSLGEAPSTQRTLNTFFGVIVPCCLSMFSVVLFLRMGFIIGQAGLIQALIMLVIAFLIIALTVTSVCAISTNGAVEAGGAYFMISRALGPEMGASIGLMFYLANAAAVAMYIFGMCETIIDDFGPGGQLLPSENTTGIPTSQWIEYGYGTALLFLVAVICLVGADIYAKAVFGIFIVVGGAIICVIVSFFVEKDMQVPVVNPDWPNRTELYTGFSSVTFHSNLYYTEIRSLAVFLLSNFLKKGLYSFSEIFALLFCYKHTCLTAITHILERTAQGELKNPSKSIPLGTIVACSIVCFTYILLMMFIAATCPKALLNNNYTFLQAINFWPPIVFIGIFFSSFSAALSSLIGASRVLHAMANDGMFGPALRLMKKTNGKGNPYVAVMVTWGIIQVVLLIGKLNAIAPLVTIFFLLAYTACDLACLGLDWASAPNFRPTFKYFSWHTALLGVISTMAVMFLVNYIWALAAMAIMIILSAISHYTAPQVAWGSISQALIFHQVRKYALKMNVQDASVDSWRPGILFLVKDITTSVEGLLFVNDLKKSGLLVLGHVNLGNIDQEDMDSSMRKLNAWYDFVKKNNVKAFVEHTTCPDLRLGAEQLLRLSGLGGMKANTLVMNIDSPIESTKDIITDAIRLDRNVVLMKNVTSFNRNLLDGRNHNFIDIWPTSLTSPGFIIGTVDSIKSDANAQFLLQLGCLLSRSHSWKSTAKLRIFIPIAPGTDFLAAQKSFKAYFMELRINAVLVLVTVEYDQLELVDDDYVSWVNSLVLSKKSGQTGVTFLQLPSTVDTCMGFISPEKGCASYLTDIGPVVMTWGLKNVISV